MFDAVSPLNAPPPRYQIESDSSDEEGQGAYPASSGRRRAPTAHRVEVRMLASRPADPLAEDAGSAPAQATDLTGVGVVAIGQAGRYLLRRARAPPVLELVVDSVVQGSGVRVPGGVLVAVQDGAAEAAYDAVMALAEHIPASSWTLVSSYVPSMYIPRPGERLPADAPVRYLSTGDVKAGEELAPYASPNYVTGLAGAFLSQAAHPASPLAGKPTTLLLLPLPLSRLAPAALAAALHTLPTDTGAALARPAPWSEDDDERFAGPGMGRDARSGAHIEAAHEASSMYM